MLNVKGSWCCNLHDISCQSLQAWSLSKMINKEECIVAQGVNEESGRGEKSYQLG